VTPAGKIERLEVPRDREGEFVTEVFERYKRMTGDVEEAVLEMYLSGISVRKIAGVTEALSRVKVGKDAVSRIASRLEEEQTAWRERSLEGKAYPYLYLDATYLKVRWGVGVTSMALLVCVGVDEEGFREVLAVEVAGSEKGVAYASLLAGASGPGSEGSAPGGLRRPRRHKGRGGRRAAGSTLTGSGAWCISSATCSQACRRVR
jgi:putative transposase